MKKIKLLTACALFSAFALTGCDIAALNDNPNEPTGEQGGDVLSEATMTGTIRGGMIIDGDIEERLRSLQLDYYAQTVVDAGGYTTKNYDTNDDWNQRTYEKYQTVLFTLTTAVKNLVATNTTNKNLLAFAKTWRVYIHSLAADKFGPLPFATPENVSENVPYRSVEDVYDEYFKELKEASELYTDGKVFTEYSSDVIFDDLGTSWQKFNNSLWLRLAMRLSEVAPDKCKEQVQAALAAKGGVMTSTADDARCKVVGDGSWGNKYNYYMFQVSWGSPSNMSRTFERLVTGIGGIAFPKNLKNWTSGQALSSNHPDKVDPRAVIMFMPAQKSGDWRGIPYGPKKEDNGKGEYVGTDYAEMGGYFYNSKGDVNFNRPYDVLLYSEVCFLKAEAYLRGFASGGDAAAKTAYEDGVKASFENWGAQGVDEYLASAEKNYAGTSAKWDDTEGAGNTKLEKIITQKYIAGGCDLSQEAWSDKRRLNLPRMDVPVYRMENLYNNSDQDIHKKSNFIQRMKYPVKETLINKENYAIGVKALGGDDQVTTPLWWAKGTTDYCTSTK